METILNIMIFILMLGVLIFVHELGHFLTAKKSGVHIYEFSLGMGPVLKSIKGKDGINYSIRALPIGGFVQMAGEVYEDDDTDTIPKEKFMCNRPWYQRLIILCAGVFNNFLLALLLLFTIALIWGAQKLDPIIYSVEEDSAMANATFIKGDSPSEEAKILDGDTITAINGKKVSTWDKAQLYLILKSKDNKYTITVKHENGGLDTFEVEPEIEKDSKGRETKKFGINIKPEVEKGFLPSVKYAGRKLISTMEQMWLTVGNLFTGKISINDLSGPVGIYSAVGESRKAGVVNILLLTAYLSINLGIMNILPIPALDGGHVLFLLIEKITRKKMNQKIEAIATNIFFILLLALMAYVTLHDIFILIK